MVSVVVVPHDSFMVKRWPPNPTMVIAEKVDMIMRSSQRGSRCVVVGCYGRERLDFSAFRSNNETKVNFVPPLFKAISIRFTLPLTR